VEKISGNAQDGRFILRLGIMLQICQKPEKAIPALAEFSEKFINFADGP
jgi:hypothetical protein